MVCMQRASVPNFKFFGPIRTELRAFFTVFTVTVFAHQHGYHHINVCKLSETYTAVTLAFVDISA